MALRITIDVFSGRPNPSVVVTGLEEREILERIAPVATVGARGRAAARAAAVPPPRLGYRGVVVEPLAEVTEPARRARRRSRPAAAAPIRIAHGVQRTSDGGVRMLRDAGVEQFITGPAGPFRSAALPARLFDHLASEVERARAVVRTPAAARARAAVAVAGRCACAPIWDPLWWNDGLTIQTENNCYNYAADVRTDTYAQPGRASGAMYASLVAADVHAGAIADALVDAPAKNRCPGKGHLVALCMSDWDFHWYRKQRSGAWTHKPGPDPITQLDNANAAIPDPRTADRGPYTQFVGFMIVQHGHVKIG